MVKLSRAEVEYFRPIAEAQESRRNYFRGASDFRRGLTDSPTLRGMIGEHTFCKWINGKFPELRLEVDVSDKPRGDGGIDLMLFGVTIQVKTRSQHLRGVCLIRRQNDAGDIMPLPWHLMVSVTIPREIAVGGFLPTTIDGFIFKDDLPTDSLRDARRGNHMNLEVPDTALSSVGELFDYLEGRKNATRPS
jgi:hypothetical protein